MKTLYKLIFTTSILVNLSFNATLANEWSYKGETGPEKWGELSSEYETCKYGKAQSPIEITDKLARKENQLKFNYQPSYLHIVHLGKNAQINYDKGSYLELEGKKFDFIQFHFHAPSEHVIDKKRYSMEIHLVHKSADEELAVIGIFVKEGKENPFLQSIIEHIPDQANIEKKFKSIKINIHDIMPDNKHFEYNGSLTTPPCTEGVHWNILETPIEASLEQIQIIKDKFGETARNLQQITKKHLFQHHHIN